MSWAPGCAGASPRHETLVFMDIRSSPPALVDPEKENKLWPLSACQGDLENPETGSASPSLTIASHTKHSARPREFREKGLVHGC